MEKIETDGAFFNVEQTLSCGQAFRWEREENGFLVHAEDKTCFAYNEGGGAYVCCEDGQAEYFYRYFDLAADYGAYVRAAEESGDQPLARAARAGKGIRILNQGAEETLFSFLVSQNNNIPRIKGILNGLCRQAGGEHAFGGRKFFSFPAAETLADFGAETLRAAGLGYRAEYLAGAAEKIASGAFSLREAAALPTEELCGKLRSLRGVGKKVADCAALFGFHRFDVFPADTWIVKLYKEDYGGKETDAAKIAAFFAARYGKYAGIFQQYLFREKRGEGRKL